MTRIRLPFKNGLIWPLLGSYGLCYVGLRALGKAITETQDGGVFILTATVLGVALVVATISAVRR